MPVRAAPRPWIAVVLSLATVGLGHLYAWRLRRALGWWLTGYVVGAGLILLVVRARTPVGYLLALCIAIGFVVVLATDGWRTARRVGPDERPTRRFLWTVIVVALVAASAVSELAQRWIRSNIAQAYRIPSASMEPTVLAGDWLFVVPHGRSAVERDALVVFDYQGTSYLKRVIGLPGDTLAMEAGRVIRNGTVISEPYTQRDSTYDPVQSEFGWLGARPIGGGPAVASRDNWGPLVVPADSVFVLGDNRSETVDSRYIGFIAISALNGRPTRIYYSRDPNTGATRWGRMARAVR